MLSLHEIGRSSVSRIVIEENIKLSFLGFIVLIRLPLSHNFLHILNRIVIKLDEA